MLGHKFFYYGFGIGIITTSLLLLFNTSFISNKDIVKENEFHIVELQEKANELNYSVYPSNEVRFTEEQFDAKLEEIMSDNIQTKIVEQKAFLIQDGMNSTQVGRILLELELISEIKEFEALMTDLNLHRKVKTGYYVFEQTEDLKQIIDKITE
ncbi:hypothetical protein [Chengkuizengella axinellae]|uniref:Endolytic transglycosylase MltG n=1 Tax=Chengkuizengella axinellae TaxID=3064388 RepID=A0ABT9IVU7_9BACL|nr:hypothetical protein [Chengkuizengella sp. 2205SS18-9]MDP5273468.1 hypothetical protein [Chengkuizengella sp. 2205SS18-9]